MALPRRRFNALLLCLLASFHLVAAGLATAADAPNFVVFLTDDQGWGDLGCYGHPVLKTPNIDRFAKQGMRFTQCYAGSAFCSPSRSAILTGRTPYRNGVFTWLPERDPVHLRRSEITIATLLKKKGYATCHVGKWHLNGFFNSPKQPQPNDHGYDHWFATQNNAAPNHKNPINFVRNGKSVGKLEGFSSILVAQEGIDWLKNHRDPAKPFFMTVWTHEPHLPIESDPKFMDLYEGDDNLKQHHGNISQLDHAFGTLMNTLDELKLSDNTFVIYTSDNGPEGRLNDQGLPIGRNKRTRGSTGGLRGRKRDVYEGGIRVPGIVRWPGKVKAGAESNEPIIGSDIFTTICAITKTPLPSDRAIDGASILPAFDGKPIQRKIPLYWRCNIARGPKTAMRIGDWKILSDEALKQFELYNVGQDPHEKDDLVDKNPAKFKEMRTALRKLNAEIEAEGPDWWVGYQRPKRAPRKPAPKGAEAAKKKIRVVVWDEQQPEQKKAYSIFLGQYIADYLKRRPGLEVASVSLAHPEKGLSDEVLDNCDVLIWWGHVRNGQVSVKDAMRVVRRIRKGELSMISLHSAHWATPFIMAMHERARTDALKTLKPAERKNAKVEFLGKIVRRAPARNAVLSPQAKFEKQADGSLLIKITRPNCCFPAYRNDGLPSEITTLAPKHPIAEGVPAKFKLAHTEMYDEPFHVPPPDRVIFEERWEKGEHFRSGAVWNIGKGKVFYFRPGHETHAVFTEPLPMKIVENAVRWLGK